MISIYTKGVCRNNQHPHNHGGYGATILMEDSQCELAQGYADTSNIRMELRAVIAALNSIQAPANIIVSPGIDLIYKAFSEGMIENWQANSWYNASMKPVKNRDLWQELLQVIKPHKITWTWAEGHETAAAKLRASKLAGTAADSGELLSDKGVTTVTIIE